MTELPEEVVAASGVGAEFFDEPEVFYLTYERHIRRWAALGERAREATGEFLETLQSGFEIELVDFSLVTTVADTAGGYRQLLFAVEDTPYAEDRTPAVALTFGWPRRSLQMMQSGYAPFAGVRVGLGPLGERARETFLGDDGGAVRRLRKEHGYRGAKELPVYADILGKEKWWADLDEYRCGAVSVLGTFAKLFVPQLRRTVAQVSSPGAAVQD